MKTLGEVKRITFRAYSKVCQMLEEDDKSNPKRTARLEKAREILDGSLDGLDSVREWD